jgi:transposase
MASRLPLEIVERSDTAKGLVVLPKRWDPGLREDLAHVRVARPMSSVAEDFENLASSHLAFVQLAMIRLMMRRIVRPSAAS